MTSESEITSIVANLEQRTFNWRKFTVIPPWIWLTLDVIATGAWVAVIAWSGYRVVCWFLT